ncbi:ABC transporter substrate binding protein [Candidatus Magnetomorum sp. HK-1]|nr:ABC transporter substrate binding protein [Candidatus Magnetomorum sp. HK-1]
MKRFAIVIFFFIGLNFINTCKLSADQKTVLILNTRKGVAKYDTVIQHFRQNISYPIEEHSLLSPRISSKKLQSICSKKEFKLIYCVGSKACKESFKYSKNKKIIFSSLINWQRVLLPHKPDNIFGVSNEFNSEMMLTLFRLFVPDINDIGIIYSDKYNKEWIEELKSYAKKVKINIISQKISHRNVFYQTMINLLKKIKVFWLISDPVVINNQDHLFEITYLCDKYNIPIFSYNSSFINHDVTLTISSDLPTIGRQAATIANDLLSNNDITYKIQYPAGSFISVNMSQVKKYNLILNNDAFGLINQIKE